MSPFSFHVPIFIPNFMKLKRVILKNFRPYKNETRIDVSNFTAFVGKNDIGKSCVLEALEIFFNEQLIKLDAHDLSKGVASKEVTIGCVFTDLPIEVILDKNAHTTLSTEYLLNQNGDLEIHKIYNCALQKITSSVFANANHPSEDQMQDLLNLKNDELKEKLTALSVPDTAVDKRYNPALRKAIWDSSSDLKLQEKLISLDKEDAKKIWTELEKRMPTFALFQSDRPSNDEDSEVQDPMKLAVQAALAEIRPQLDEIKNKVKEKTTELANRTLIKLQDLDPALASQLSPHFRTEPKWDQIFKMMLTGDDDIPVNKRGSGVRRLILLSFFRAEAERRREDSGISNGLIYAIEEPETSQHPDYQRMIVQAFMDLTENDCQVMITTHNPALAGLIPTESVRYVHKTNGDVEVQVGNAEVIEQVINDLGVLPDNRVRVIVCVEGPNDIIFLKHLSRVCHMHNDAIPDLSSDRRVAFVPMGGANLQQWVDEQYLKGFNRPEAHFYDRDSETPPKYQQFVNDVNARTDGSYAVLTGKREAENYLHSQVIQSEMNVEVSFTDSDSVPRLVAQKVHEIDSAAQPWTNLTEVEQKAKTNRAKRRLNDLVASKMSYEQLTECDPNKDIENFFVKIGKTIASIEQANPRQNIIQ